MFAGFIPSPSDAIPEQEGDYAFRADGRSSRMNVSTLLKVPID
ncbi:hypothetical protein I551_6170 [Mycobacterium ulcerans str. Harvey]|uniref:Uncharacterized protein n=1 Tax=Mycobacterium ulcerans str. Harvey TaxID=1299332 RepID=A0ABP3A922_MYCUL|nr:hypothetical protein I551_6170 [Mycobacterium ulcerans str. Harvey]